MFSTVCKGLGTAALAPTPAARTAGLHQQSSAPPRRSSTTCTAAREQQPRGLDEQEEEEERPALYGDFVRRPLIGPYKRTAACRRCAGSGSVPCGQCGGSGRLARGGYHKRNPVNAARLVGSKWTAMERTFGWRHFRAVQKQGQGKGTLVLLQATCDESTQFWVNMQNLKDRGRWASGWLQKQEILALEAQQQAAAEGPGAQRPGGAAGGTPCKGCAGSGAVPCPLCSLAGQVVEL
ncbi:hypothetical protein ABPG75_008291 [Micractinium tetrahymenae]